MGNNSKKFSDIFSKITAYLSVWRPNQSVKVKFGTKLTHTHLLNSCRVGVYHISPVFRDF